MQSFLVRASNLKILIASYLKILIANTIWQVVNDTLRFYKISDTRKRFCPPRQVISTCQEVVVRRHRSLHIALVVPSHLIHPVLGSPKHGYTGWFMVIIQ